MACGGRSSSNQDPISLVQEAGVATGGFQLPFCCLGKLATIAIAVHHMGSIYDVSIGKLNQC